MAKLTPPSLQSKAEGALIAKALSHSFGPNEILRDISFKLSRGSVVSIVGPSGGGKTTLLHLCADLLEITEGRVENTFASSAFAFQEPRLIPWATALDNIAYGLKAYGVSRKTRTERATKIAHEFGLESADLNKFPKDLSGGMRQRVSFARALVIQPELLFLDEPFSALDIGIKQELQQILAQEITENNLSILFITHDLMEAVRLSDHILLLAADPGRIVHRFSIDTPLPARDNEYVYTQTAKLLIHPKIAEAFELSLGVR